MRVSRQLGRGWPTSEWPSSRSNSEVDGRRYGDTWDEEDFATSTVAGNSRHTPYKEGSAISRSLHWRLSLIMAKHSLLMTRAYKEYNRHFLLEPTKLNRIVDTIHSCIGTIAGVTLHDNFQLYLKGDRREELSSVDEVLATDNSRKYKIERLAIHCSAVGAPRTEYEAQVDFGGPSNSQQSHGVKTKVVAITIKSDNPSWNSRTLSQVEEQVERTWVYQTASLGLLIVLLVGSFLFLASQFVTLLPSTSATWWLNRSDRERLTQMLKEHPTLTDENLREIETRQLKNVLREKWRFSGLNREQDRWPATIFSFWCHCCCHRLHHCALHLLPVRGLSMGR
jgi:hypothetical protein